jgi:excisionase family DNA binding protein
MEVKTAETVPLRWLTIAAAAAYLSCRPRTIRELIWQGFLKRARVGRRFLIDVDELDALVSSRLEREIDPDKPARISVRERVARLRTQHSCGSRMDAGDPQSTAPVASK